MAVTAAMAYPLQTIHHHPSLANPSSSAASPARRPSSTNRSPHAQDRDIVELSLSLVAILSEVVRLGILTPWDVSDMLEQSDALIHSNVADRQFNVDVLSIGIAFSKKTLTAYRIECGGGKGEDVVEDVGEDEDDENAVPPPEIELGQMTLEAARDATDFFRVALNLHSANPRRARKLISMLKGGWWKKGLSIDELAQSLSNPAPKPTALVVPPTSTNTPNSTSTTPLSSTESSSTWWNPWKRKPATPTSPSRPPTTTTAPIFVPGSTTYSSSAPPTMGRSASHNTTNQKASNLPSRASWAAPDGITGPPPMATAMMMSGATGAAKLTKPDFLLTNHGTHRPRLSIGGAELSPSRSNTGSKPSFPPPVVEG
ncbi:hypothetical protein BJ742DRAFT_165765 [Cladochytrium replicatum]|nr:hypothetical protein BJ742DRAFT_165765 [Cladochytrium replicatum]